MRIVVNKSCYDLLLNHTLLPSPAFGALQDAQKIAHDQYRVECSPEDAEVLYQTARQYFPESSNHILQAIRDAQKNAA